MLLSTSKPHGKMTMNLAYCLSLCATLRKLEALPKSQSLQVSRESLYRALSAKGNPRLSTLFAVARAIGLKLTVKAALVADDYLWERIQSGLVPWEVFYR